HYISSYNYLLIRSLLFFLTSIFVIFGIIFTPLIRITYIVYEWNYSDFYLQTSTSLFLYTNYIMVQGLFLSQNDIVNLQISIYFIVLNKHLKKLHCTVEINVFCIFKIFKKAPSKHSFFHDY